MDPIEKINLVGQPNTDTAWRVILTGHVWRVRQTSAEIVGHVAGAMNGGVPVPRGWVFTLSAALLNNDGNVAMDAGGRYLVMESETLTVPIEALQSALFVAADALSAARMSLIERAEIWHKNLQAMIG
jgi:hypothetical protein